MSNNELAYFYILDWSDSVIDIREQYPLSDLSGAVRIAAQAGIKYPADKVSGYPYVLTCDFMVTTITGVKARTIKMTDELESDRVLEKLEIERRYWLAQGIEWKIITEREILFQKAKNIEWLCTEHNFSISSPSPTGAKDRMMQLLINGKYSIIESAYAIENEYSLPVGTGIQLFKQLVLAREFTIDLDKPINLYSKEATA
jgi:hypothetical protein